MTLRDLIDRCRNETRDTARKVLWSDLEWIDFLNESVDEACIRARLIENEAIELDSSADEPSVTVPDYIWSIRRVTFDGRKLILLDKEMLDACEGERWEEIAGTPMACYEVGGKLRLYPIPVTSGAVKVHAFCTPKKPMEGDDDVPEGVKPRLHGKLTDWALRCAYSKKDADTFDANLAVGHEATFEKTFGSRPDEKAMRRLRINVRRHVAGSYF